MLLLFRLAKVTKNTEYPALNSNEIKHYISETKADIKLCTSSFRRQLSQFFCLVKVICLLALKRERPTRIDWYFFLMKQHFMCLRQSTGITIIYGDVKIIIMIMNMGVIHLSSICGVLWWKTKLSVLFFLKNLRWLATLFWSWWGTLLCVTSLREKFLSYMVHYFISPVVCVPFWTGSFLIVLQMWLLWMSSSVSLWKTLLTVQKCKIWMSCVTESSELQTTLPQNPMPGEKLNVTMMCVVPLMAPIEREREREREREGDLPSTWGTLWSPVFENVSISPAHFMAENVFYFITI